MAFATEKSAKATLYHARNRAGGFCDENCMNSEAVNLIFGTESDGSGFLRFGVFPRV